MKLRVSLSIILVLGLTLIGLGLQKETEFCEPRKIETQDLSSVAVGSCSDVFNQADSDQRIYENPRLMWGYNNSSHYTRVENFYERFPRALAIYRRSIFYLHDGMESRETVVSQIQSSSTEAPGQKTDTTSLQRHWEMAVKSLNFVLEIYKQRREHWSPEFLKKLRVIAQTYLRESTYITVRLDELIGGKIIGSLRVIKEKEGLLPMERVLNIRFKKKDLVKLEPGNFAVEKKFSQKVWPELIMHLLSRPIRELGEGRKCHFYTYADRYSLQLYSQLGFKPVQLSDIELGEGVQVQDGKILADGTWWTPMEASQADLDQLLDRHIIRLGERGHDIMEGAELRDRLRKLDSRPSTTAISETKMRREFDPREAPGTLRITDRSEIDSLDPQSSHYDIELAFAESNSAVEKPEIRIWPSALPLKEGIVKTDAPGSCEYRNRKLHYSTVENNLRYDITIDIGPDLKNPTRYSVVTYSGSKLIERMQFSF